MKISPVCKLALPASIPTPPNYVLHVIIHVPHAVPLVTPVVIVACNQVLFSTGTITDATLSAQMAPTQTRPTSASLATAIAKRVQEFPPIVQVVLHRRI